jgi:hypothetical protein
MYFMAIFCLIYSDFQISENEILKQQNDAQSIIDNFPES